ncbi:MAG: hypothetical protein ACRD7E_26685 [Bryobacteraceae bacterium]
MPVARKGMVADARLEFRRRIMPHPSVLSIGPIGERFSLADGRAEKECPTVFLDALPL